MTARDEAAIAPLLDPDNPEIGSRPIHGEWKRPAEIDVEGGLLVWSPAQKYIRTKSDPVMFERFLSLVDAPEKDILRFAKRYGVLGICPHGAPSRHDAHCRPTGWGNGKCQESFEDWRFFSRSALALLKIGAAITSGDEPMTADWVTIYSRAKDRPAIPTRDREAQIWQVEECLNEWLSWAMPTFEVSWPVERGAKPRIEMKPAGLFGALALQLVLRVGRKDRWASCFHCGALYSSQRAPKAGQRHFCPKCRSEKVPQQYAHEDLRQRRREGHE